ncbi:MAG: transcriptional regulator [Azospirillum brasilense]|nr:MAG: transcriptional regulator [Azospirillum brasilense]
MAHTTRDKAKLTARVKRLRGQVEAIERGLENEVGCVEILQLVASVRGAINGLMGELIEDHIREHVVDPAHEPDPAKAEGARDLIEVLRTYMK